MSAACGSECNGTWPGPEPRREFHVRDCPNETTPRGASSSCDHEYDEGTCCGETPWRRCWKCDQTTAIAEPEAGR